MPRPKWYCHSRLTSTRAVIGLRRSVSHSARARRLPRPAVNVACGLAQDRGYSGLDLRAQQVGIAAEQDVRRALAAFANAHDLDGRVVANSPNVAAVLVGHVVEEGQQAVVIALGDRDLSCGRGSGRS